MWKIDAIYKSGLAAGPDCCEPVEKEMPCKSPVTNPALFGCGTATNWAAHINLVAKAE